MTIANGKFRDDLKLALNLLEKSHTLQASDTLYISSDDLKDYNLTPHYLSQLLAYLAQKNPNFKFSSFTPFGHESEGSAIFFPNGISVNQNLSEKKEFTVQLPINFGFEMNENMSDEKEPKEIIVIDKAIGVYKANDKGKIYKGRIKRFELVQCLFENLETGLSGRELVKKLDQSISTISPAIRDVNKLVKVTLEIPYSLIIKAKIGYKLNTDKYKFSSSF